jgi:hypothetical protein
LYDSLIQCQAGGVVASKNFGGGIENMENAGRPYRRSRSKSIRVIGRLRTISGYAEDCYVVRLSEATRRSGERFPEPLCWTRIESLADSMESDGLVLKGMVFVRPMIRCLGVVVVPVIFLLAPRSFAAEPQPRAAGRQVSNISGWTVMVSDALLADDKAATEKALKALASQLEEISRVVPAEAVAQLRKVTLWFSPEYPGVQPRAEYHPDAGWLRENGRDPAMAKSVEFTNVRIFERETKRMPNFTLHELAHAYHDRVLDKGFDNPDIKAAFDAAKRKGLYDRVEQRFGDGRSAHVRAYALMSPMEYFAECSEAFFSTNDFFPFAREQLAKHDPGMFSLMKKLWSVADDEK